jgi:hypothetical protein
MDSRAERTTAAKCSSGLQAHTQWTFILRLDWTGRRVSAKSDLKAGTVGSVMSCTAMRRIFLTLLTMCFVGLVGTAQGEMPPNVRCAIKAQEAARNMGRQYQETYNSKFEHCMLNAMPKEEQTTYLIEKLKPYVAISPGLEAEQSQRRQAKKVAGTWVRVSPNVWVLED